MKKDYAKTADTLIAALGGKDNITPSVPLHDKASFLCERQIENQRERDLKAF